ncbi:MAG: AraC family transcriptional regulator [Oscillospiraceae bacterium]|nr:AraC family transcriptional regulator [Oscillospiraceae bacterium]
MENWVEGFQQSIDYMERNLADTLEIEDIAGIVALSPFYYQRIFGALCGMTVGEYIRARRMTLAAQELSGTEAKVIDVALKYGYDSPDSFAKAFQRFHGIAPSKAREPGAPLRSFAPLHIKITMEGGTMLNYRIVEKAPFTVVGVKRPFHMDTSYQEIPKFWDEWLAQGEKRAIMGTFGVCIDTEGKNFDYWIADLYFPWEEIPEGCETRVIPGSLWAEFPCTIGTLQDTNTRIWSEWLPALQGYSLAGDYDIEVYLPPAEGSEEMSIAIWIPLKKD